MKCDLCQTDYTAGEGALAEIWGQKGTHCNECINAYKQFQATGVDLDPEPAAIPAATTPITTPVAATTQYTRCHHNLSPLLLPDVITLYLSGSEYLASKSQGPEPQAAVYLDIMWLRHVPLLTNDGSLQCDFPVMAVGWPDMHDISLNLLGQAVEWAMRSEE